MKIDIRKAMAFFVALSGADKESREILMNLNKSNIIEKKDMSDILDKGSRGVEKVAKEIKDLPTRRYIYREVYSAAYLDRKITEKERKGLERIREILSVDKKTANRLEKWVRDYIKLLEKGKRMIIN